MTDQQSGIFMEQVCPLLVDPWNICDESLNQLCNVVFNGLYIN